MARVVSVSGRAATSLSDGWEMRVGEDGEWIQAVVPGTAAQALRDAGLLSLDRPPPLHDRDVVYRRRLAGEGARRLRFHGLATIAEVSLDGERILASDSMFEAQEVPVTLRGEHDLTILFRALNPVLKAQRGRGRWPVRLAGPAGLRAVRTTLFGHMPGWCPPIPAVGPWRPVELIEESGPLRVLAADLRSTLDGADGRLRLELSVAWDRGGQPPAELEVGEVRAPLGWTGPDRLAGEVRIPDVEPWWPHTHGSPTLYPVGVTIGDQRVDLGRTGFRTIERAEGDGFALRINGEPVFCRGACWSSADVVGLPGSREAYAPWLHLAREAGMNMLRLPGITTYEGDAFFELCDELGILVWQDFMFANFDYPADEAFLGKVRREAAQLLDRTQASPSLAVLCGGSEAEQQAAMLGLPRTAWSQPVFETALRGEAARWRPDLPYVSNSPTGGPLPFAASAGVTHYYGVGAYRRPLEDARRAEVRFATECLAFANVPEPGALPGVPPVHDPRWKARVPRDPGAPWDFEDVRDHYLRTLFGADPPALRYEDPDRYLRLSRAVTGAVMEAVFAEWRRAGSSCGGGLVWMFQDLWPGAGWGVVDSTGTPKAAWHALRRAFRPVQVLLTDEGVNGLAVHLLNETARPVEAVLRLTALRGGETPVVRAERPVTLAPRSANAIPAAELLDRFFDLTYAYRFGPPAHDATVAALVEAGVEAGSGRLLAEAFHVPPSANPLERHDLGLSAAAVRVGEGWELRLRARRLACWVHVEDDGFRAAEDWFHLPPGEERCVRLIPKVRGAGVPDGEVCALNGGMPVRFRGDA
ncbi:glycoside hydrolase family 2 protein [Azospirillum rugosum]|uniref:Beta-mannosidase n=1 Tax=Azospirillum rugosum TaxID=416170 RepID=A0ABS4SG44_9PROT|nr:glycoside hydrolase family 2 protein [Azospirillum rugosum]MBP2291543.1 beta-mannosidase [Azospirillum rugosum]MDQ0525332.1 beta-mannosidase [Azospirillum rugosum]